VTSGRSRPPLTACALSIALVRACVGIAAAALPREFPVTTLPARRAAHLLRRARRHRRHEHLSALGTSPVHPRSVRRRRQSPPQWITIPPEPAPRSCAGVGHDPAAKWISVRPPLKRVAMSVRPAMTRPRSCCHLPGCAISSLAHPRDQLDSHCDLELCVPGRAPEISRVGNDARRRPRQVAATADHAGCGGRAAASSISTASCTP